MTKTSILIVEDEAIVAENLSDKLEQLGYDVTGIACRGEEAREMALHLRPELILMDIQLDGPKDGIWVAEAIQKQYDVPVIYLTAHSDPATLARAKVTGPLGYILKPFEMRDLATQIELALYRHQTEQLLREQRELLRVTLTSIGDAVIATDGQGLITFMNPVAETLTGWPLSLATGKQLSEVFRIVNEYSRETVDDPVSKVLKSGMIVGMANHTILLQRGGGEVSIDDSGAPIFDKHGNILGVVLVFRDISARRRAEAEREKMLMAIEQVGETILITDPAGNIEYVNPAFERITGYSKAEVIGKNPRILKSGKQDRQFYDQMWKTIAGGKTYTGHLINKRKDGTYYTDYATISPVLDAKDRLVAYVSVKRDVTDQLALEEQFHQAQKMESVGRLAGGIAHDFNNMLGVILGHTELAMDQVRPGSPLNSNLSEIHKAAQRSADLTRQLLAFARKQNASPQVLDCNDTVTGMIAMLRRLIGEGIDLAWMPGANLWPIKIDPAQVDQILANLCVNARDAIDSIGNIIIETKNAIIDPDQNTRHATRVPGQYVMLTVSDTGCGMDQNTLENLFEPFFTTKEIGKGTGLGLATVYGIVQQNGGFIDVTSEPGKGARIRIFLPRTLETRQLKEEPVAERVLHGSETLLLVEDEGAILQLAKTILKRLGYTVLASDSPLEALAIVEKYKQPVHLLITDVVMPEMSGSQLKDRVKQGYPDIKVLFMSGYTADTIAHQGFMDNDIQFLQKPFSNNALAQKVRDVLDDPA